MKRTEIAMFAVVLFVLQPVIAQAQEDGGDGSKTIILTDPDHPLNGAWRYVHAAGTVVCPYMTVPMPASKPEVLQITAHDGGARLEITAQDGHITMQRVTADEWESEVDGDRQVLRRKVRDDANWIAWAAEGMATFYEGTQTPGAGLLVRYIMGWAPDSPDVLRGHITSEFQGCKIHRAFEANRAG